MRSRGATAVTAAATSAAATGVATSQTPPLARLKTPAAITRRKASVDLTSGTYVATFNLPRIALGFCRIDVAHDALFRAMSED